MASIYNADDPAAYERSMGRWSRLLAVPFLAFAAPGPAAARALDVGCGTGSLAFAAAERLPGAAVTGLDHSEAYVGHARSRARAPRSPGCASSGGTRWRSRTRMLRSTPRCRCWC